MLATIGRHGLVLLSTVLLCAACLEVREDNEVDAGPKGCGNCHLETGTTPAHLAHVLDEGEFGGGYDCSECHPVPGEWFVEGHVDGIVQVEFREGGLARADGAQPTFDGARCYNVYCHGGTMTVAGVPDPLWNDPEGNQKMTCGDCHGTPPGQPHPAAPACEDCHGAVYDGEVLNKQLHLNGQMDLGLGSGGSR